MDHQGERKTEMFIADHGGGKGGIHCFLPSFNGWLWSNIAKKNLVWFFQSLQMLPLCIAGCSCNVGGKMQLLWCLAFYKYLR